MSLIKFAVPRKNNPQIFTLNFLEYIHMIMLIVDIDNWKMLSQNHILKITFILEAHRNILKKYIKSYKKYQRSSKYFSQKRYCFYITSSVF